jgi:hypothetical protein
VSDHYDWTWLPGPHPELGDEHDRAVAAALATRDAGRALFAFKRWVEHYNRLALEAAPASVEAADDVLRRWAAEDDG